jgi:hypothetical protein
VLRYEDWVSGGMVDTGDLKRNLSHGAGNSPWDAVKLGETPAKAR